MREENYIFISLIFKLTIKKQWKMQKKIVFYFHIQIKTNIMST